MWHIAPRCRPTSRFNQRGTISAPNCPSNYSYYLENEARISAPIYRNASVTRFFRWLRQPVIPARKGVSGTKGQWFASALLGNAKISSTFRNRSGGGRAQAAAVVVVGEWTSSLRVIKIAKQSHRYFNERDRRRGLRGTPSCHMVPTKRARGPGRLRDARRKLSIY